MKAIFKTWVGICLSASVLLLAGCGGGGEQVAGVGSGGTGSNRSYAAGVVTQSDGELVVNGVHFDTTDATVSDATVSDVAASDAAASDADEPAKPLAPAAIQPGMMVEVEASSISNSGGKQVAKAERIRIASQITGHVLWIGKEPIKLPDMPNGLQLELPDAAPDLPPEPGPEDEVAGDVEDDKVLYVLGMKVFVRPETRFDETLPNGFSSVEAGKVLEVHGFFDVQNHSIIATRIIKKPDNTKYFTLQGKVVNLDALKKSFQLDGWPLILEGWQVILQNLKKGLEDLLQNGRIVRVQFLSELLKYDASGPLPELRLSSVSVNSGPTSTEKLDAVVDGLVTHIHDNAGQRISINNVEIDLAGVVVRCENRITVCPAPKLSDRLRVRGDMVAEKLIAKEVVLLEKLDDLAP